MQIKHNDYLVYIDDEDHPKLLAWGYSVLASPDGDIRLVATREPFKRKQISRLLLNAPDDKLVDHKNGNTLDARKDNLRLATYAQNGQNRAVSIYRTLPKGVSRKNGKFRAVITVDRIQKHLGMFLTVEEASAAYIKAAQIHFGAFAFHNRE